VSLGALALVIASVLIRCGEKQWAAYLLVTAAGSLALNAALKLVFARSRPHPGGALWQAQGYAFPSGHAMSAMAIFGALVYLVLQSPLTWRVRSAAVALALLLIAAISLSRVYLGAHWLSDVAAGLAVGFVWLAVTTCLYDVFQGRHQRRGRVAHDVR
jgi:undecaprenyl-diphosphatase